jgi:3-deoxy-D-manno-octulosonate 8-phosphate phosphatase (KDO 8-P phosphatase)
MINNNIPFPHHDVVTKFKTQLEQIKVALFDVDGILTDGRVYWDGNDVGFNRFYHVRDGYGLKLLQEMGIKVGVISGGNSVGLIKRFENLKIDYFYYGNEDKRKAYLEIKEKTQLNDENFLYMADEHFDLPILNRVGLSITVADAPWVIRNQVHYTTEKESGMGAVREVVDLFVYLKKFSPKIEQF